MLSDQVIRLTNSLEGLKEPLARLPEDSRLMNAQIDVLESKCLTPLNSLTTRLVETFIS